ncbi:DUF2651 family protein [Gracilibacillus caseinilyticus]|uniref:DUF2651 family protein n=1 Tax=Gracilibacillus caseinilyticus TaxID=2932256 RepID=UPI00350F1C65
MSFSVYGLARLLELNEFQAVVIIFPITAFLIDLVSYALLRKSWIGPSVVFITSILALFLFYNNSILIWIILYSVVSLIGSFLCKGMLSKRTETKSIQ